MFTPLDILAAAEAAAWAQLSEALNHVACIEAEGFEPDVDDLAAVQDARAHIAEFGDVTF